MAYFSNIDDSLLEVYLTTSAVRHATYDVQRPRCPVVAATKITPLKGRITHRHFSKREHTDQARHGNWGPSFPEVSEIWYGKR